MQQELFDIAPQAKFPTTRYQGSKLKYVDWIWYHVQNIPFNTALDAFGGTGAVSYKFKQEGKKVTYNDILTFNSVIGKALIENDSVTLDDKTLENLLKYDDSIEYPNFVERTFKDIYYTDEENKWLDMVITNIRLLDNKYKQAIAYFALFQSCIIKRPYNLFHRKNLYIRTQEVKRTFGNKITWDTSFEQHYRNFVREANDAVFSNTKQNKANNSNVYDVKNEYDLVYIDTPYISGRGVGTDYHGFYHFLEGIMNYDNWEKMIDSKSKHKRLIPETSEWTKPNLINMAFDKLIHQFKDSTLVISYRSDGVPSIGDLQQKLEKEGKKVTVFHSKEIKYVLSNKSSNEVLLIAQ